MAPRSRPKRHKSAESTCVLTKDNEIRLTGHGFLVDGVMRPNLDDCKLEPGVKFEVLYDQLDDEPAAQPPVAKKRAAKVSPQSDEDAVTVIHTQPVAQQPVAQPVVQQPVVQEQKNIKLPAELQELQELIDVYQDAQGAGPYVAIAVVAAYLYRKFNKKRQDEDRCDCEECRARRRAEHRAHHAEHRTQHAEHRAHHAEPPCSCAECVPPAPVAAEREDR